MYIMENYVTSFSHQARRTAGVRIVVARASRGSIYLGGVGFLASVVSKPVGMAPWPGIVFRREAAQVPAAEPAA